MSREGSSVVLVGGALLILVMLGAGAVMTLQWVLTGRAQAMAAEARERAEAAQAEAARSAREVQAMAEREAGALPPPEQGAPTGAQAALDAVARGVDDLIRLAGQEATAGRREAATTLAAAAASVLDGSTAALGAARTAALREEIAAVLERCEERAKAEAQLRTALELLRTVLAEDAPEVRRVRGRLERLAAPAEGAPREGG